jgi:CDP-diacylglycerol--glycerol-3-phosphate 3-phosphatidyltransferase
VIAARELFVSGYRSLAGRRGISLPARPLGKYKAFVQYLAVGAVLLPWTAHDLGLQQTVLVLVVALTVISAIDIVQHGWRDWQRVDH